MNTRFIVRIAFMLPMIVSCENVFFDQPQPVDSKNLISVPKELQGIWGAEWTAECKTRDSIIIDKTSYRNITNECYFISNDELNNSEKYKIMDGKIYLFYRDDTLSYRYNKLNDSTICYNKRHEELIPLSDSAILRKARKCYILNLRTDNWWEIIIIQKKENGEIMINYPFADDLIKMKSETDITLLDSTDEGAAFFHAEFKSKEMERIINKEGEGILYTLRPDSTFEVKDVGK
jgi:hypothetical protein